MQDVAQLVRAEIVRTVWVAGSSPAILHLLEIVMSLWEDRTMDYTSENKEAQQDKKLFELYAENSQLRAIIKYLEHKLLINNNLENLFKNKD